MIDTGANKNYISPKLVNIENCQTEKGIKVSNIRGTFDVTKSATFDPFQIKKKLKFYIFKFHNFFDGLIGYESLRDLNAQIDIRKNTLIMGRKTIQMLKKFPNENIININEQEFQYITIKTKKDGDFLIANEKQFKSFTVLPGLYKSNNHTAVVAIQNRAGHLLEINSNEIEMDDDPYDLPDLPKTVNPTEYTFRSEHMNEEEKKALKKLIDKYKNVLYVETDKLSFTHKIKHRIRTVDNIPVHSKSYKYPYVYEQEVQDQVKKMLKDGIIKESISPYTSPVW